MENVGTTKEISFSLSVKEELCRITNSRNSCIQAEIYGILLFCNLFTEDGIRIMTKNAGFAKRLIQLFKRGFKIDFDYMPEEIIADTKMIFLITDMSKLDLIYDAYGIDPENLLAHHINFAVVEDEDTRKSFFRGAFLASGSVTDPMKRYHLEFITSHYNVSREMHTLLLEDNFQAKEVFRKSNYITYFKNCNVIEDFLTLIGAPVSAMEIMNAQEEKNLRNSINRRVNCEGANLDKVIDAAAKQTAAIQKLKDSNKLNDLNKKMVEIAELRLQNPGSSLAELAEMCNPPTTKSTVSYRLKQLEKFAKEDVI